MVVEVCDDLHREIRGIGFVERPEGIYKLTNTIIEESIEDQKNQNTNEKLITT
jgi:hypothetical protein